MQIIGTGLLGRKAWGYLTIGCEFGQKRNRKLFGKKGNKNLIWQKRNKNKVWVIGYPITRTKIIGYPIIFGSGTDRSPPDPKFRVPEPKSYLVRVPDP